MHRVRGRGRPKKRWTEEVKELIENRSLNLQETGRGARSEWERVVYGES